MLLDKVVVAGGTLTLSVQSQSADGSSPAHISHLTALHFLPLHSTVTPQTTTTTTQADTILSQNNPVITQRALVMIVLVVQSPVYSVGEGLLSALTIRLQYSTALAPGWF